MASSLSVCLLDFFILFTFGWMFYFKNSWKIIITRKIRSGSKSARDTRFGGNGKNEMNRIIFPQDPATAIPKGTLLALLISMLSYALMVLFSGGAALRDASGNLTDLVLDNGTVLDFVGVAGSCINTTAGCTFGLHNSYSVSLRFNFVRL